MSSHSRSRVNLKLEKCFIVYGSSLFGNLTTSSPPEDYEDDEASENTVEIENKQTSLIHSNYVLCHKIIDSTGCQEGFCSIATVLQVI